LRNALCLIERPLWSEGWNPAFPIPHVECSSLGTKIIAPNARVKTPFWACRKVTEKDGEHYRALTASSLVTVAVFSQRNSDLYTAIQGNDKYIKEFMATSD